MRFWPATRLLKICPSVKLPCSFSWLLCVLAGERTLLNSFLGYNGNSLSWELQTGTSMNLPIA